MIGLHARARGGAEPRPALPPRGPLWVQVSEGQPHPVDLRWVDGLVAGLRGRVLVRPEDELLILVPNTPVKVNRTALRILHAMLHQGAGVAEVLAREGDGPRRRREIHDFFTDLAAWLRGDIGEGEGRRAVVRESFRRDFCRYPVLSEVALTYRCNLSCAFCYAGCGGPGETDRREMSDAEVRRVLEAIRRDARCPSVSFTGGEPTLRPGLPGLVRHARGLGLAVNLISNGQLVDDRLADALAAAGLDSAQLSLEGPDAALHDGLVGRAGAFGRLWRAAELLRARGVRVHTNTTVNRRNLARLGEVVDLVAERGMARLTMNLMIPCGRGALDPALRVAYAEAGAHVLCVRERAAARGVEFVWYSPLPLCVFNTIAHGLGNRGCAAADGLLHVDPSGEVLPCSSFPAGEGLGNLLREGFEGVWGSAGARHYREKRMMPAECAGCVDADACQGACVLYWRGAGPGPCGPAAERARAASTPSPITTTERLGTGMPENEAQMPGGMGGDMH